MAGLFKSALIVLGFFVSVYFIHGSVSSLNKINLLTGQHRTEFFEQQGRYQRALTEDEVQYGSLALPKPVPIIKCCNKSDFLTTDLSCISRNVSGHDTYDFFPKDLIVDSNFFQISIEAIKVVYGTNLCRDEVLVVKDEDLQDHVLTESGELLSLTNSGLVHFNYSTNYCIDNLSGNSYMILKCPCRNHFCVQKCCAHNQYYDTNSHQCRKLGHLPGVGMDQLNKLMTINSTREPYLLYRPLNCSKLLFNVSGSILVDENYTLVHGAGNAAINSGNLIFKGDSVEALKTFPNPYGKQLKNFLNVQNLKIYHVVTANVVSTFSYCIDAFSDGRNCTNFNGFYCQNVKQKRQTTMNLNKCCRKGESLNEYYQCRFKMSNTVSWTPNSTLMGDKFKSFAFRNIKVPDNILAIHLKKNDYVLYIRSKIEQKLYITDILKNYAADEFCVDEYQEDRESALIFSPCQHIMCLQKCCPYGSIFNLTSYKCEESADKSNAISLITTNELNEVGEYFLINTEPNCHFYKLIHPNLMGAERMFLQQNGDISKRIEKTKIKWVPPAKYCIDTFFQGSIRMSNGFFCLQSKNSRRGLNLPEHPLNNGKIRHHFAPNVLLISFLIFFKVWIIYCLNNL